MIRVVFINTGKDEGDWPARIAAIGAALSGLCPDIVCLQEVYVGAGRDIGQALATAMVLIGTHVPARAKLCSGIASTSGVAVLSRQPPLAHAAIDLPTTPDDGGRKAIIGSFTTTHGSLRVLNLQLSYLRTPDATRLRTTQLFFAV